jgi:hypothetical protein
VSLSERFGHDVTTFTKSITFYQIDQRSDITTKTCLSTENAKRLPLKTHKFRLGAAGNIDFCEKIKVSILTSCRSDVRVFRNKITLVTSRSLVMSRSFPCVLYSEKRMTTNVAITTRCKYNADYNAPLYRLVNAHFHYIELETMAPHFE